jgi:conjugative relaxase-like TrwC/TraI family protein
MLRSTLLNGRGESVRTGANVLAYAMSTEYYRDREGNALSASQWIGNGCDALGLAGDVDLEVMEKIAHGRGPTGEKLRQNSGDNTRVGHDFTFSAVKPFDFVYSIASNEQRDALLETHHAAVAAAMDWLAGESRVRTGKAGLGEQLETRGLVASRHTHFGSRELDPQIHSHVLIYNAAQGSDGKWRALHADYMCNATRAGGALYRAEHAWQLRQQGYGIVKDRKLDADGRETGEVFFKIAGIDQALVDRISTRRTQILEHIQQHGGTFDQAALATRKHKDEPTYGELLKMWEQSLKEAQAQDPTLKVPTIEELQSKSCVLGEAITDDDILKRLHKHESSFTRHDLIERIALEYVGQKDAKAVLQEVDAFLKRAAVVELTHHQDHKLKDGEVKYAAQWMLDMEQDIGRRGRERLNDVVVMVSPETVEEAVTQIEKKNGFKLSQEQVDVALHQCSETGGTAIVSGRAGTGKTTTSEVAVLAWRLHGQEVLGVSTGWEAAQKLEAEAGIPSFSAEKLLWDLDNGELKLTNRHVLIFDEAGMAGTEVIHRLQGYTDAARAKLVAQGDKHQLQPVSAGNPFDLLTKVVGHKELTDIRRQKSQADRDLADLHYTEAEDLGHQIISALDSQGRIYRSEFRKQAAEQLADHCQADPTPDRDKIAICGTRVDVRMVNNARRDRRKAAGELGEHEVSFQAKSGGAWHELKVAEGERVRFTARDKDKSLGVVNGFVGVVEKIEPGRKDGHRLSVRLESDIPSQDGRVVAFDTADYQSLTYAYAMTVHKSQGQGKTKVFHLASPEMADRHLQLVAFTRTKEDYRLYGAEDDIARLAPKLKDRYKRNASEQLAQIQNTKAPVLNAQEQAQVQGFGKLLEQRRKQVRGKGRTVGR